VILALLAEAEKDGAAFDAACNAIGLSSRTVRRWRDAGVGDDGRAGPHTTPAHALTPEERVRIVEVATSAEFRDVSPKQIVPRLADQGIYIASESSFYRVLHDEALMAHREPSRPRTRHKPNEYVATAPGQVWTWDITYLRGPVRGTFFYLYLVLDIFSRKIVAAEVHAEESAQIAGPLVEWACKREAVDPCGLTLHADNGGPMKGSTMLATLQRLGVVASFSRPSVSDDNPYVEAIFRTLKFRPGYPRKPFASLDDARRWVEQFVHWYNHEHLHSAIRYVAPIDRHEGRDAQILAVRHRLYRRARSATPRRWTRDTRDWTPVGAVVLNPSKANEEACMMH
jgi:transposase InsO family protein